MTTKKGYGDISFSYRVSPHAGQVRTAPGIFAPHSTQYLEPLSCVVMPTDLSSIDMSEKKAPRIFKSIPAFFRACLRVWHFLALYRNCVVNIYAGNKHPVLIG